MALNIKDATVERLASEVAALANESKAQAVRNALEEHKARLKVRMGQCDRQAELRRFLEAEVWSQVPSHLSGARPSRTREVGILGYGRDAV